MEEIRTEMIIPARQETVWKVLTNFPLYREWNPVIPEVSGDLGVGRTLEIQIRFPLLPPVRIETHVMMVKPGESFCWKGHMFSGRFVEGFHFFELQSKGPDRTLFVNREVFSGILSGPALVPLARMLQDGYERMNLGLRNYIESEVSH